MVLFESGWRWTFKATSGVDFDLVLFFDVDSKLMSSAFGKALDKLNIRGEREGVVDSFVVDDKYLHLFDSGCKRCIKKVRREVGKDGVSVVNVWCDRILYKKQGIKWVVQVCFKGQYVRELGE